MDKSTRLTLIKSLVASKQPCGIVDDETIENEQQWDDAIEETFLSQTNEEMSDRYEKSLEELEEEFNYFEVKHV